MTGEAVIEHHFPQLGVSSYMDCSFIGRFFNSVPRFSPPATLTLLGPEDELTFVVF